MQFEVCRRSSMDVQRGVESTPEGEGPLCCCSYPLHVCLASASFPLHNAIWKALRNTNYFRVNVKLIVSLQQQVFLARKR